jgi:hypothetical protein
MTPTDPGLPSEVGRLLCALPREQPPEIALDDILRRLAARRRAAFVSAVFVAALIAGTFLLA